MTNKIDLIKYTAFVEGVTSPATNHIDDFMARMNELQAQNTGINLPLLLNAAIGMAAEGGEFAELPKKIFFQGKAPDEAAIFHMKRELGDIIWYWTNACRALGLDPNEVIAENVNKLESRYPGGKFDPFYSENRKEGDL
jgi:NTP pyrophosphatase (non-canonical NTP hydrolase)